jgi:hypothetical protein
MDNWVDNTKAPDLLLVDPNLQVYQQSDTLNVLNVTNWQTIPGSQYSTTGAETYTLGHDTNPSPFGFVGYSSTQTNTYASQTSKTNLGYWSNLGSSYNQNNGFITDVSIQPYIRQQQVIFRAKGLKVNTPVKAWFDGVSVDKYIVAPNIIELNNLKGTFEEDDVIGFYDTVRNGFYPIGTVVATYNYANTNNIRLYITGDFHSSYTANTNIISNAKYDTNGNYVANTAYGTAGNQRIISLNTSGYVSSVGGSFSDANNVTITGIYASQKYIASQFANLYGIWNSATSYWGTVAQGIQTTNNIPSTFDAAFNVNFPSSGYYYFGGDSPYNASFYLDNILQFTASGNNPQFPSAIYVSAGIHKIRIYCNNPNSATDFNLSALVALAISTAPFASDGTTAGTLVFSSLNPPVIPTNSGTQVGMPGGGVYYVGATQVALNPMAQNSDNFYVGAKINITTTFISQPLLSGSQLAFGVNQQPKIQTSVYTATITAYDGASRIATLNSPVNVSLGNNGYIGGIVTSTYSIQGTNTSYLISINGSSNTSPSLSNNENGDFSGVFNIPQNTFKTGSRIFRIDNRTVATDGGASASTWAEATYTASGLSTKSQAINFSPSISSAKNTFTRTQYQDNVLVNSAIVLNPWDPVAQSFIIDPATYPNGAFLTSAKFFFQSKPTTSNIPVQLSIVGTSNGYPNGETLDNSLVNLTADKVNVSDTPNVLDSTTYTEFSFPAPVYIKPGTLYAFIIHSASNDYQIYLAKQGGTAIPSTVKNLPTDPTPTSITKIGTSPYVASLFISQNAITWTADQTAALMFSVNSAKFDTTKNPTIQFVIPKNLPTRKLMTQDIQKFYGSGLVNNFQGIFTNTDVTSHAFNLTTTDLIPTNTKVNYTYQGLIGSTSSFDVQKSVVPGKYGSPTYDNIYLSDNKGPRLLQANSSATFSMYASLSSTDTNMSPFISDDGTSLYNIQWNINNLSLSNGIISLVSGGSGYYNANTISVSVSAPTAANGGIQAVAGFTANTTSGTIQSVYITNPGSGYLNTPTIAISDANTTPGTGANVVCSSEFSPSGGNAATRYITKKNKLSLTNTSKDLRVYFSAYRPIGTNIYVFYRVQNSSLDNALFENGPWQLMTFIQNSANGYSTDRTNAYEFICAPGVNGTANNQLTYTSTSGTTYASFDTFAIKIVMTTNDNTFVPFLTNLRVLALPSGTGI